jgi:hypothetical protein
MCQVMMLALPHPQAAEQVAEGHPFAAAPGKIAVNILVGQQAGTSCVPSPA